MNLTRVFTPRLELVRATGQTVRAAADSKLADLGNSLRADVASDWPPDLLADGLGPFADQLEREPPKDGYTMWFTVLREPRTLIGTFGFKAPPTDGRLDLGYNIVASHQRRGYATEATEAMIAWAMDDPRVDRVVAETFPDLVPSIRVLEKCGFTQCGAGVSGWAGEEGVVQYELTRKRWQSLAGEEARTA